ncbi:hypothetical protein [Bacillus timonensis]|uniref:hypothetical protein n=1 Tax=Bacillus timonensis TaxID=1033734 RepID=UPI000289744A|nr:hypothetical protein [Bacillus timonensis]
MNIKVVEDRPLVLSHQAIRFETAQSWNCAGRMGNGKIPGPPGDGNGGPPGGAPNMGNVPPWACGPGGNNGNNGNNGKGRGNG